MAITRREALLSAGVMAAAGVLPTPSRAQSPQKSEVPAALGPEFACLTDFEPVAKQRMSSMAWEYVNGAAADEITVKGNREAYQKMRLKPHVLVDVSALDTRVTLFGKQ